MSSKCPVCGGNAYIGAFTCECDTKGCQNYAPPKKSVAAVAAVGNSSKEFIWDRAGDYFIYPDGTKETMERCRIRNNWGMIFTWGHVVQVLEEHNPSIVRVRPEGYGYSGEWLVEDLIKKIQKDHPP